MPSTVEKFIVDFKARKRRWPKYNEYLAEPYRPILSDRDFGQVIRSMRIEKVAQRRAMGS